MFSLVDGHANMSDMMWHGGLVGSWDISWQSHSFLWFALGFAVQVMIQLNVV